VERKKGQISQRLSKKALRSKKDDGMHGRLQNKKKGSLTYMKALSVRKKKAM